MELGKSEADNFDDIRPYDDTEVLGAIRELTTDPECTGLMASWLAPLAYRVCPPLLRLLASLYLRRLLRGVVDIRSFQEAEARYAKKLVEDGTHSFRYEGFDALHPSEPCLFISNHRDIAGDSLLLNYSLFLQGFSTVRIAIGDNLVQKRFATAIMRLNKGFFIKRSAAGPRKTYAALLQSSRYIQRSLSEGESVWIAQREGRSKDGLDATDPAIIKMLLLANRKESLAEALERLRIVPLSISYEYDPCDQLKAKEAYIRATEGSYRKPEGEDLLSLVTGLAGQKGQVILRMGEKLSGQYESVEAVASEIDKQIVGRLELFPINYWAVTRLAEAPYQALHSYALAALQGVDTSQLEARLASTPKEHLAYLLRMYANPVVNRHRLAT